MNATSAVIIPAYNPDIKLRSVVSELLAEPLFSVCIVVNDGSAPETLPNFPEPTDRLIILTHSENRGKGAGIKTALKYITVTMPDCAAAVFADADGQHATKDIVSVAVKCAETGEFTMGSRDFRNENVPDKSKFGNNMMKRLMKFSTGRDIGDTQTGLRAIPRDLFEFSLGVSGERYEYETEYLLQMSARNLPIREIPIETVYYDGNAGTHFRPIADSFKIIALFGKFAGVSLLSAVFDNLLFALFRQFFWGVTISYAGARLISSVFNFTVNRKFVFKSADKLLLAAVKYFSLALVIFVLSDKLLEFALHAIDPDSDLPVFAETGVKLVCDGLLFALSFVVQRFFIFGKRAEKEGGIK
jgi:glycosyltransferase involved in cell wall biosynthesis